jgi:hypothetical protein
MGNTRTLRRPTTSRTWRRSKPTHSRSWVRRQPAANPGSGAKKGLLMAAAPMIGGLVIKRMRSRHQAKKNLVVEPGGPTTSI